MWHQLFGEFCTYVVPDNGPEKKILALFIFIAFLESLGWEEYIAQKEKNMLGSTFFWVLAIFNLFWHIWTCHPLVLVLRIFEMLQCWTFPTKSSAKESIHYKKFIETIWGDIICEIEWNINRPGIGKVICICFLFLWQFHVAGHTMLIIVDIYVVQGTYHPWSM